MLLHIIKQSTSNSSGFSKCIKTLNTGDGILLIENGVYNLNLLADELENIAKNHSIYILKSDATTRGITAFPDFIVPVNYEGFVDLTLEYSKSISW